MPDIKVSICCAVYNHKLYIEDCIKGFLMQKTDFDFEILIHDDASTDGTTEIIKEYERKYPEIIRVIYQTENQYSSNTRAVISTFLLPIVKGEYIAFCEGDDYWTDSLKLQKQVDILDKNLQYSACMHNAIIHYAQTGKNRKFKRSSKNYIIPLRRIIRHKGHFYPTCTLMFRRSCYENYPQFCLECHVGDYPLILYLALQKDIFYLSDVMAVYRKGHKNSWTSYYRGCKKEKQMEYLQSEIKMLEQMNVFTDFRYNQFFKEKIMIMRINYGLKNNEFKKLTSSYYKKDLKEISIMTKMKLLSKMYLNPKRLFSLFISHG